MILIGLGMERKSLLIAEKIPSLWFDGESISCMGNVCMIKDGSYCNIFLMWWCIFSQFIPGPSRRGGNDGLWSSWRCPDKSISIRIHSQPCLSANFSSSEKPVVIVPFGIFHYPDNAQIFGFFHGQFSFGIVKFLCSSYPTRLSLL